MRKHLTLIAAVAATGMALTSCSLGSAPPGATAAKGSLTKLGSLKGVTITVGSKEFTEQLVLCEISALSLESAGAKVKRSCNMSGSNTVRTALLNGDVDLYWEYTGTGWIDYLKNTKPITDPQKQYQAVAQEDKAKNKVLWLSPAPANDTYAIATTQSKAAELKVNTLSDYARLAKTDPSKASFCGASEFFGRPDGWPGVEKAYGFTLPHSDIAQLAAGPIYNAIHKSSPCNFGEVFVTDGRIASMKLKVLEDNKQFFAVYNPAITIREQVADAHPQIAKIMAPVAKALDNTTLQTLNADVDVKGEDPEQVAKDWLQQKGFIG
jgi:osmoprotectant transport system substrate-binding protein